MSTQAGRQTEWKGGGEVEADVEAEQVKLQTLHIRNVVGRRQRNADNHNEMSALTIKWLLVAAGHLAWLDPGDLLQVLRLDVGQRRYFHFHFHFHLPRNNRRRRA